MGSKKLHLMIGYEILLCALVIACGLVGKCTVGGRLWERNGHKTIVVKCSKADTL